MQETSSSKKSEEMKGYALLAMRGSSLVSKVRATPASEGLYDITVSKLEHASEEDIESLSRVVGETKERYGQIDASAREFARDFWEILVDEIESLGFRVEDAPMGDFQVTVEYESRAGGRMVAAVKPLYGAVGSPPKDLARNLVEAMSAPRISPSDLISELDGFVKEGEHISAAQRFIDVVEGRGMGLALVDTLEVIIKIDAGQLTLGLRRKLLNYRIAVLVSRQQFHKAQIDVERLLTDYDETLTLDEKSKLRLLRALGLGESGKQSLAYITHTAELAKSSNSPKRRGWILRNLSLMCDDGSGEREHWGVLSVDAFREAGERHLVAGGLTILLESYLRHDVNRAIGVADEIVGVFDEGSLVGNTRVGFALMVRAKLALRIGRQDAAAEDLDKVTELWSGLGGMEQELEDVYMLRRDVAILQGKHERAQEISDRREELYGRHRSPRSETLVEVGAQFDSRRAAGLQLQAENAEDWCIYAATVHLRITKDGGLKPLDKVELVEGAISRCEHAPELRTHLRFKLGNLLYDMGVPERALECYRGALEDDPLSRDARQNLIVLLMERQGWEELEAVAEQQIGLWGELPALRVILAVAWLGRGRVDDAATVLWMLSEDGDVPEDVREMAKKHLSDAMRQGGSLRRPKPLPTQSVTLDEWDEVLRGFAGYVSGERRKDFWRREGPKYKWVSRPETLAKVAFATWINGRLVGRVDAFEEVDAGAGRIDVYVVLSGGLRLVVELKMIGGGYSSTWGYQGEDQIVHYMNNRRARLGYLVMFDARKRDFGLRPKGRPEPPNDVRFLSIDMRMQVAKR